MNVNFTCPECGATTELVTKCDKGFNCQCSSDGCGSTWETDDKGEVLSGEPAPSGVPLRSGQRFSIAVLASKINKTALNLLSEDWGELKGIDPKLTDFKGSAGDHKPTLPVGLGKDSSVSSATATKSASAAIRDLQLGTITGAVFSVDGADTFAIWRDKSGTYNLKVTDMGPDSFWSKMQKHLGKAWYYHNEVLTDQQLYSVVNAARKCASEQGATLSAKQVGFDANRSALRQSRYTSKSGHPLFRPGKGTFMDPSGSEFRGVALTALRDRLATFKAKIAPGVDTPEQMVAFLNEKGFLDKIRIGKYAYELGNAQIDIKDVRDVTAGKGSGWHKGFTVSYTWDDSQEGPDWYDIDGERPPREFTVHFKMVGGTIIPSEIHVKGEPDDTVYTDTGAPKESLVNSQAASVVQQVLSSLREKSPAKAGGETK